MARTLTWTAPGGVVHTTTIAGSKCKPRGQYGRRYQRTINTGLDRFMVNQQQRVKRYLAEKIAKLTSDYLGFREVRAETTYTHRGQV